MARLGIDYGTTNTVVVCSDRGRYPVVPHFTETAVGPVACEVFPSRIVYDRQTGTFLFGSEAERCLMAPNAEARYDVIPSFKRQIRDYVENPRSGNAPSGRNADQAQILRAFATALRQSILRSGLFAQSEPLQAVITWPANANGAQRYLTRRCFREAGFEIVGTLAEPSAAAIEFADRIARGNRRAARRVSMSVAVFDLGGGTLDVSLVRIQGDEIDVLCSAGIEKLGGDDFDLTLARLFAEKLRIDFESLRPFQQALLLMQARQQKENISGGASRFLTLMPEDIGLAGPACSVTVDDYYRPLTGMLEPAIETLHQLLQSPAAQSAGIDERRLDTIYMVGGSSKLPLVPRMVADRFPHVRLVMTDKPFTSTAMGAAIHSTEEVRLRDVLSRTFGVLRLADTGYRECFSPIFPAGTYLPRPGQPPLEYLMEYSPRHNIGYLRYLECATTDRTGMPSDGIRPWSEVLFPYDPAISPQQHLTPGQIVSRYDLDDKRVRETYSCDSDGIITVRIERRCDGYTALAEIFKS